MTKNQRHIENSTRKKKVSKITKTLGFHLQQVSQFHLVYIINKIETFVQTLA